MHNFKFQMNENSIRKLDLKTTTKKTTQRTISISDCVNKLNWKKIKKNRIDIMRYIQSDNQSDNMIYIIQYWNDSW